MALHQHRAAYAFGGRDINANISTRNLRDRRLLEFCSERELVAQTGHPVGEWPLYIQKELVDDAIDAAEEAGDAPQIEIAVDTSASTVTVTDNGPGIPPATVDAILDFSVRVSSREAYVSPTRGAQGNALKTIIAMPFVLNPEIGETVCIEAHGVAHHITFAVDNLRQEPRISVSRERSFVKIGSRVTVHWPEKAWHLMRHARDRFLQIADLYRWFNPHLDIRLTWDGAIVLDHHTIIPAWPKWYPGTRSRRTGTPSTVSRLIGARVDRDRQRGRVRWFANLSRPSGD